jgi:hypothetical protein
VAKRASHFVQRKRQLFGQTLKPALFQIDEGADKENLTVEELNVRSHCLQPARVEEI